MFVYGGEGGIYTLLLVTGRLIYVHVLDCVYVSVCVHVLDCVCVHVIDKLIILSVLVTEK